MSQNSIKNKFKNHLFHLTYYADDNGVWLVCSCGWRSVLGYNASPETAMREKKDHLRELANKDCKDKQK